MPQATAIPITQTKGQATRQRVLAAALDLIDEAGIAALSQDATARRAGISQSTLRHHFTTKDDLVDAMFDASFDGFVASGNAVLLEPGLTPRARLVRLVTNHIDYAMQTSDRVALESFVFTMHNVAMQARRDRWQGWVIEHYAALVAQIRPELPPETCAARATALLTLSLGTWISFGRSRTPRARQNQARAQLGDAMMLLIDG